MFFIIDHINHLMNESKILIFVYNSDRRVYVLLHTMNFVSGDCLESEFMNFYVSFLMCAMFGLDINI